MKNFLYFYGQAIRDGRPYLAEQIGKQITDILDGKRPRRIYIFYP